MGSTAGASNRDARVGQLVNLAEFAQPRWWTGTDPHDLHTHVIERTPEGLWQPGYDPDTAEWQVGLEWQAPRDVSKAVVQFADRVPSDLRIQYWRHSWPTPAPERLPGARRGWIAQDDPWHGCWTNALGERRIQGATCSFSFDPVDLPELGAGAADQLIEAQHYLATFRRTLKVRLVSRMKDQPLIKGVEANSSATWGEGHIDVRFGISEDASADWSGSAKATNGYVLGVEAIGLDDDDHIDSKGIWSIGVDGKTRGVRLRVLYAACEPDSNDHTVITVHTKARSFSFLVHDLDRGPIFIQDYGVLVNWAGMGFDLDAWQARREAAPRSIYDRVIQEPEQSLNRAMAEIPPLDVTKQGPYGRYLPLGVEGGRHEWALRYNGGLFGDKSLLKLKGRDAARLQWPSHLLRFRFGTGDPPDFRERRDATRQRLLENWIPVVTSEWLDREIEYQQTAFAALLDGPVTGPAERRGNEDVVVMMRFSIRNTTHYEKRARLWMVIAPQEDLELRNGLLLARGRVVPAEPVKRQWRVDAYAVPCLRLAVLACGKGSLSTVTYSEGPDMSGVVPSGVAYDVGLAGGESDTVTLAIPFVSLTQDQEWRRASALDYDAKLADVVAYWRGYVESGATIDLPDRILNEFHKSVRTHIAISVDKDPVSGLTVVPAATWAYGACGNEACWQITMLDQAGHHDRAEDYLETFLRLQGAKALDGNFSSAEGTLLGVDLDGGAPCLSQFSYNLDHGYIMECLVSHYRYSGDRAWLERVAPKLVAACDLVARERARTMTTGTDSCPDVAWGLMPAGHLEDNKEWRHWFAVNAHAYNGMKGIADVLGEIGHPEAGRLAQDAESFRQDIRRAALRAMVEAPVVRLLDGTYVPHIPTRTGLRGRAWGWFREAAYGAAHLLEANVFEPNEEEMTWAIKDLEDNLFVSREWGRPVDLEKYWFSQGGVAIQANLMDTAIDYLRRGEIEHGLRALFNNFGASLYADVRCFTEHPVIELGHGVGPFYKSSDEAKALIWLRAFLLHEEGSTLHIAMGAPRAWFASGQSFAVQSMASFFGPVSYRIVSRGAEITARVELSDGREPEDLIVHLRHPERKPIQQVTVNGAKHADFCPTGAVRITSPPGGLAIQATYK